MTIDERQQIDLHRQLLQEALGDVALMPLFWLVEPVPVTKGVKGVASTTTANIFEWEKDG